MQKITTLLGKHAFLVIAILMNCCSVAFGQNDIIHTVKGEKITCVITREDSSTVYFKVGGAMSKIEANLQRKEITSIEYGSKKIAPPVINPANIERDDYVAPPSETLIATPSKKPKGRSYNQFSLLSGYQLPVGDFADANSPTSSIGPGMNGYLVQAGFTHLHHSHFLIGLNGFYTQNEVNTTPSRTALFNATDSTWTTEKAYWKSFGLRIDAGYHLSLKDLSFSIRGNAGFITLIHPQIKYSISSQNYRTYQSTSSDALVFGGALNAGYRVLEDLFVNVELGYMRSKNVFNEILIIGEDPYATPSKKFTVTQRDVERSYENISLLIGLSYRF